ncbi:M12 family metallo-peptidase [Fodinibius sp.]|uniref:M12 family metallo-peptidase n=1 Tax=Fodinibius sp. TaxID=1872440 RepID=UPI003A103156
MRTIFASDHYNDFSAFIFQSCLDSTGPENKEPEQSYSHVQNPGTSANDFLADSNFTHLVVEVDYMPSYEPNAEALDSLKAFFEQRLHKNSITIKEPTQIESRNQDAYSASDVRNIESQERSTFSEGDTLAAYFMIVDGEYNERELMGIAYFNTSNAFFGPAYDEASSGPGSISRYRVEAISFRHEFGHLFGLVDIPNSGTEMQEPHRDQEHGNHCDNDQCLMYYATQTTDLIGNTVGNEEITPLDENCIADLQANGGK